MKLQKRPAFCDESLLCVQSLPVTGTVLCQQLRSAEKEASKHNSSGFFRTIYIFLFLLLNLPCILFCAFRCVGHLRGTADGLRIIISQSVFRCYFPRPFENLETMAEYGSSRAHEIRISGVFTGINVFLSKACTR